MIKIDYDRQRDGQSVYENYIGALQDADKTRIVWYSAAGNDTTGDGTVATPYQTRAKANSETSSSKPYALLIEDFYIPGYTDNNIVYLDTVSGNDSNDGSTELLAKLTYASAATAASTTKKIRVINDGAVLDVDITKPTEAKAGIVASIQGDNVSPIDTFTQVSDPGFGASTITSAAWSPKLKLFVVAGEAGKTAYSVDGINWNLNSVTHAYNYQKLLWSDYYEKFYGLVFGGDYDRIYESSDGINWVYNSRLDDVTGTYSGFIINEENGMALVNNKLSIYFKTDMNSSDEWQASDMPSLNSVLVIAHNKYTGRYCCGTVASNPVLYYSDNGLNWFEGAAPFFGDPLYAISYDNTTREFILAYLTKAVQRTADGINLGSYLGGTGSSGNAYAIDYVGACKKMLIIGDGGLMHAIGDQGDPVPVSSPSFGSDNLRGIAYSSLLNRAIVTGGANKIAYSTALSIEISNNVFGFNVQHAAYTGTLTKSNCSSYNVGSTASISTVRCRFEEGCHISNNVQTHNRLLTEDKFYISCTPASQNAVKLDAVTCENGLYIFNASQTGYELIRDSIIENGIKANYLVNVLSGNVRGTSTNASLSASVGTSNPLLYDDGRPNRPWLPNGSGTESPVIAVAKYSTNSDGVKNDLGCFIVNDEDVGHTYKKSKYLPSGSLKIGKGIESSEQVSDDGEVDVFGNPERAVEVVLINYESLSPEDTAFIDELDELNDYHVRLNLYPSTQIVTGSVTVNGNQSSGAFTLAVDSTAIHPGATLTIGSVAYYILYASPNYTAATTLVLNKPLESNVSDNDVITTSYPAGYGEYSYSPKARELQLSVAQSPSAYFINVVMRFIRKWQS